KVDENPPKKRSQKPPAQPEAAETAHPEPDHHEGGPAKVEHHQPEDMEEEIQGDDVVCGMEEMEHEGVAAPVPTQRPTRVNPYDGQPEPEEFPGGPSDKT
ncbi:hypothetical protein A2U01_0067333, partial [Trifolium medium]|nr:hypothetical protein [Trifolium medium]